MGSETDYRDVQVPEDTPPKEYHWSERRAEILRFIEQAGHPEKIKQADLARRYGVSEAQISKDMKRLRAFMRKTLGNRRLSISETVYRKAVKAYMDSGEYDKAIKCLESWNEWLREEGVRDTEPDKLEVGGLHDALMQDLQAAHESD